MFNNLTLKTKFIGLEAISLLMFIAMAAFGLLQLNGATQDGTENITRLSQSVKVMGYISDLNITFLKKVKLAKDVWLRGADPEAKKKHRAEFIEQSEKFAKTLLDTEELLHKLSEGDHVEFTGFIAALDGIRQEHASVSEKYLVQIDAHGSGSDAWRVSDAKVKGIDRELQKQIFEMRDYFQNFISEQGLEKIRLSEEDYQSRRNLVAIWVILSLILSTLLASIIIRQVLRQLGGDPKEVAQVVNMMASGDFSNQPGRVHSSGSLLDDAYTMQEHLRDMIAKVKLQADQSGQMALQLSAAARRIAENVNHETDAVTSMAAAIEELSVSTTHISDQGGSAKQIAHASRSNTEHGAQVVNKTVSGLLVTAQEIEVASAEVSRLGDDASRISDIVKVIKEIADQTNLLALNAAIEAARAGEQGRGFAVVADEVRKLAERTANATNEINQMSSKIAAVAKQALNGMDQVVRTTRQGASDAEAAQVSIASIQQGFTDVAKVIDDISGSLTEQNVAATDLAKSTERVAQMSEENSHAANGLLQLANQLEQQAVAVRGAVEVFKV